MSSTPSFEREISLAVDDVEVPTTPDDIFEEIVADPTRCCQQCYRRLRSRRQFPQGAGLDHGDVMSFVDRELPPDAKWDLLDAEFYETVQERDRLEQMHPPGEDHDSGQGCRFCGAVDPHRSPSTRSRSEALQAAVGISATLSELGAAHNPLVLLVEVADLKRDPDMAGDDFGTFRTAVARAVRAGRRSR